MPINFTDFSRLPLVNNGLGDLLGKAIQGFQAQRMPGMMNREQQSQEEAIKAAIMKNQLDQKYGERGKLADIGYKEAQAENMQKFGGLNMLSGPAREALSLELTKRIYGEESDIYQNAKKVYDLNVKHTDEMNKTSEFYRNNPWRLYDPLTRSIDAQNKASQGKTPEGTPVYTPEQSAQAVDLYAKEQLNKTVSPAVQAQYTAGKQIEDSARMINTNDLFVYNGPKGKALMAKDLASEAAGKPVERYQKFQEAVTLAHGVVPQLTNYWGSSVTKGAQDDIKHLTNPQSWINSPETSARKFEALMKQFDAEMSRTRASMKGVSGYDQSPIFPANYVPEQKDERQLNLDKKLETAAKNVPLTTTLYFNGEPKQVPIEKAEEALKRKGWSANGR